MALWAGLGQAAAVAQVAGVDAGGIISMILQAVRTVRRNNKECEQLARRVVMIADLLLYLQDPEVMRLPVVRRPLDGLEDTLREAYALVATCQKKSFVYRFVMAGRQAERFRDVQGRIDSYLIVFPFISHLDITRRLDRNYNALALQNGSAVATSAGSQLVHGAEEFTLAELAAAGGEHGAEEFTLAELAAAGGEHGAEEFTLAELAAAGGEHGAEEFTLAVLAAAGGEHGAEEFTLAELAAAGGEHGAEEFTLAVLAAAGGEHGAEEFTLAELAAATGEHGAEEFTLAELAAATGDFAAGTKIGVGSSGTVYRGKLRDGREVAIKRYGAGTLQERESAFRKELAVLPLLRHKHIVRLFGFCEENGEHLVVYEYQKNGTLYDHLHTESSAPSRSPVTASWKMRIEVLLGVSRGIEYLHSYAAPRVIHGDIKSSNILLDANWVPRVSDFGTSLVWGGTDADAHPAVKAAGTVGYLDPEYYCRHSLTVKSDVYSFGVVMLEVLTGKRAIFKEYGGNLISVVDYSLPCIIAGEVVKVLDMRVPEPSQSGEMEAVELVAYTAVHCLRLEAKGRLAIADIVANLETAVALCCPQ